MDKQSLQNNSLDNLEQIHHILVIEDSTERKTVELTLPNYSIGRHSENDIVLSCQKMSRYHATLLRRTDLKNNRYSYWLLDGDLQGNKSRNGVYVNNKKCLIHELKNADVIRFSAEAAAKYYVTTDLSQVEEVENSFSLRESDAILASGNNNQAILSKETLYTLPQEGSVGNYSEREFVNFAELCPQPIIEIDLYGQIKFLNSAANNAFPGIYQQKLNHPLLEDLISQCNVNHNEILSREIAINDKIYQQYARYFPSSRLIRSYIADLTQQRDLEKQISKQRAIYQNVTRKISEGIIIVDEASKQIVDANPVCSIILGYTPEEMLTMSIEDLCFESEPLAASLQKARAEKIGIFGTCLLRHQNGWAINVNLKIKAIDCEDVKLLCLIFDTVAEENYARANYLETKFTPKDIFYQQLLSATANAKRYQKMLAIMFISLGLLPEVKENLGDRNANLLSSKIEERLRTTLRSGDTVVRWQNNKFALLLAQIDAVEEAAKVCIRIQQSLKQAFKIENQHINVTSNIGIAIYPDDGIELDALLKNVDIALHRAKKYSDNYQFFNSKSNARALATLQLEQLLSEAIEREEYEICYQPQASIDNRSIESVRASLEWEHSELGGFSTADYIRVAEQTALIIPIGEWLIATACMQSKTWQERGLPSLKVIVNISSVQFQQSSFPGAIERILSKTEFDPALLELNIAVATLMQDREYSRQTIERLSKLGVKISLSNLASEVYSLEILKQFSFDTLKIAPSAIAELEYEPQDLAIVAALVELGKGLKLDIDVEGVETEAQAELLRSFQYERLQAFWFSPALSTAATTKILCDRYLEKFEELK